MSDGESSYPTDIVDAIKADENVMRMMDFMAIGYGDSPNIKDIL
jgi:hypothetical protein